MSYVYVLLTVALTVYGQIVIKWQVLKAGALPEALPDKIAFLWLLLINPWVISAYAAALLASVFWMAAMTKMQLSHAYPFMSLAFILVILFSALLFNESINSFKIVGAALVILGLVIGSQG
jgi:multidrug transporter EmrE-like cation transporter